MADSNAVAYCGQQLVGVSIAIAVIQILVVSARFYTRYLQHTAFWLDDYLIIPALVREKQKRGFVRVEQRSLRS